MWILIVSISVVRNLSIRKNSSRMFGGQNSLIMSIGVGYVLDQDVNVVDNCRYSIIFLV